MAGLLVATALFAGSLIVLLKASDVFTKQAETVGVAMGVPPFIVGVTIVAIGTSLPELSSSIFAVLEGSSEIVVGNVVGSNIANIFFILGAVGLIGRDITVHRELMKVDLPILVASAVMLALAIGTNGFSLLEAVLFLGALLVYTLFTVSEKEETGEIIEESVLEEVEAGVQREPPVLRVYGLLLGSLVLVFASAYGIVAAIIDIAAALGIGTEVVALTAVAVGTSLPELAVSAAAAWKGTPELAVGNILGSNIFNTFAVMGVPALIGPLAIPDIIRTYGLPVMVLATLLYFFITQDKTITQWESGMLIILYVLFLTNMLAVI